MENRLMFLDCPAYLDRAGGERCELAAEVRCRFIMRSTGGPLESAIPSGAELPVAHLPGHRSLRQAGHVIVWLLLTGLAAAVVYVLLEVVLASVGGLGPHSPGPPPHPVPVPNPAPAPPGS